MGGGRAPVTHSWWRQYSRRLLYSKHNRPSTVVVVCGLRSNWPSNCGVVAVALPVPCTQGRHFPDSTNSADFPVTYKSYGRKLLANV